MSSLPFLRSLLVFCPRLSSFFTPLKVIGIPWLLFPRVWDGSSSRNSSWSPKSTLEFSRRGCLVPRVGLPLYFWSRTSVLFGILTNNCPGYSVLPREECTVFFWNGETTFCCSNHRRFWRKIDVSTFPTGDSFLMSWTILSRDFMVLVFKILSNYNNSYVSFSTFE